MALSRHLALLLLAAVLAAAAAAPAAAQGYPGCPAPSRKITVQNLCGHDLLLRLETLANSFPLFGAGNTHLLRHGTHAEFPVCGWTGRLSAPGAPTAEFHIGAEPVAPGAWYMVSTNQAANPVHVSITPHAAAAGHGPSALQGHCPAVGCGAGPGRCFESAVPGGNCHNVYEIKIVYYNP